MIFVIITFCRQVNSSLQKKQFCSLLPLCYFTIVTRQAVPVAGAAGRTPRRSGAAAPT